MTHYFFYCLLAPTWSLCMVCESACLLVYVTEKRKCICTINEHWRTLKGDRKWHFTKKRQLLWAANWTAFLLLHLCKQLNKTLSKLLHIWYCFYWLLFPMSDFNMTQHLGHVWTVLKRNMLCQASATFTPSRQKTKGLLQRMFVFLRPLRVAKKQQKVSKTKKFWFGEKGHRRFDCHTHLGQFYIWHI